MKRILSVLLCGALLLSALTGCASLFNRDYVSVSTHQEQAASDEDASILRAESYADLVSCVQHFVSMGQNFGTVHLYQYTGDIESDLAAACNEVLTQDPLGAYALNSITYDYNHIVSYYECTFSFSFCHSIADIAAITSAFGWGTIRDLMKSALSGFSTTLVLRTSAFYSDPVRLYALAQEAYYDSPGSALGYPGVSIAVYPDSGSVRIVEITFSFGGDLNVQRQRSEAAVAAAAQLSGQETAADETVATLLYSRLLDQTDYDPEGSSSVYNALCVGSADSEGLAMSYMLLCQQSGITCQPVQGTLDGVPHFWNMITLGDVSWHLDVTRGDGIVTHSDAFMSEAGYQWSLEDYPVCAGAELDPGSDVVDAD